MVVEVQNNGSGRAGLPLFKTNWLKWRVTRSGRPFKVFTVEPRVYSPESHDDIFNAVLNVIIDPVIQPVDPYQHAEASSGYESFDLVTFPEAFLTAEHLIEVLHVVSRLGKLGCVHVGLRPSSATRHLFNLNEISRLLSSLRNTGCVLESDLESFSEWLSGQSKKGYFNLGCLFTIDSQQQVRICLHPKIVRSKYETSALEERHMTEANLLTLVTLEPENHNIPSTTIQPLICSDMLPYQTDVPHARPLEAINNDSGCFEERPPDYIDIVSVVTCTPQVPTSSRTVMKWHQQFRERFFRAASDDTLSRHQYASFILSNFGHVPSGVGGLSGAFYPLNLRHYQFPDYVRVSVYGSPNRGVDDNCWSPPEGGITQLEDWSSFGYIVSLNSLDMHPVADAYLLGFTISPLPREVNNWRSNHGLVNFQYEHV